MLKPDTFKGRNFQLQQKTHAVVPKTKLNTSRTRPENVFSLKRNSSSALKLSVYANEMITGEKTSVPNPMRPDNYKLEHEGLLTKFVKSSVYNPHKKTHDDMFESSPSNY